MKRMIRILTFLMVVSFGAVMLSGTSSAANKLNLKLTKKADSIVLQWNGKKKETYTVYKKTGDGNYLVAGSVKGKKYTDKEITGGQKYSYYIKKGKLKSSSKSITFLPAPSVKSAAVNDKGTVLKWNKAEGADRYVVYRKIAGGKAIRLGSAKAESFTDTTAEKGIVYTYTVRSAKGKSTSAALSVKIGRLNAPELLSLEKTADGMAISWKKVDGAQNYTVYRKKQGEKKWKKLSSVESYTDSYEDKKAEEGATYSYFVRAVAGKSRSLRENSLSGICLKAPEGFTLKKSGKKIKLSWNKKEGAEKYQVYKKTGDGKWEKLKDTKSLSLSDKPKDSKTVVSYKVRAIIGKNESAFTPVLTNRQLDPTKPMVALTYDDGPHPENTNRILDALEKHGARATFFVVGSRIEEFKDCLKRQAKLGCEVANHSYSHAIYTASTDEKILEEITKTDRLIKKYTGQTTILCRAPGGAVGKAAVLADKPFIQWSVDTLDWKTRSCSKVVSHIKSTVRDGSIILMHDLYGSTAQASEIIIPWLIAEGYQLVTVSELLEARAGGAEGGKIYYNGYV